MNNIYGNLLVLSGPSGSGKSTIFKMLKSNCENISFSISSTSRLPRDGEVEGVDYYFISKEEFEFGIKNGDFIEYAEVHGNYYGTSKRVLNEAIVKPNNILVLDIDVQGFLQLKNEYKKYLTSIFLTPPSKAILKQRLEARATDSTDSIKGRLLNALNEMIEIDEYDYLLVNDDLKETYQKIEFIVGSMASKSSLIDTEKFILDWNN
ncbi:MAG: Guanylate kinase (EC [uncultured Campylobacterales bacterium]|uniref:Guanylate kinase n=1 Tax=uncultured Campylobacterales bacterium TaxID=352960 RepID=A0A6S6TB62_9BACT|nr:MAG: Guanylate kinase (EC [uncultured Campylobacterales bacterium]